MITFENTANYAGVKISGDLTDMELLYESLHTIVGEEWERENYEAARLRVLGVCYDLRHAIMGEREVSFVDNGLDQDKMKFLSIIASEKNVYYSLHVLWPEIIFVMMALNDFIKLHANRQVKYNFHSLTHFKNIWDRHIANVRSFQAAFAKCVAETLPDTSVTRVMKLMNNDYFSVNNYVTHFIDELNVRFIDMDKDKREKNISIMAKRISEQGEEYRGIEDAVREAARKYNCHMAELRFDVEYPEVIDW